MSKTFFEEIQGAAVFKHGILRRYLRPWASKVGKYAQDNRVTYLDGYAGPGRYADGAPGSPALATAIAKKLEGLRNFHGICVEADDDACSELRLLLDPFPEWEVVHGRLEDHLTPILDSTKGTPLFAFLDPFGLGIPFDLMMSLLERSGAGAGRVPTEVLMNFSTSGLRRSAGIAFSANVAADTFRKKLDGWLGGEWWQDIWHEGKAANREERIAVEYLKQLSERARTPWGWYLTDIPKRWDGPPAYYLLFLTQHEDGLWIFNENVSKAREDDFQEYCLRSGEAPSFDMAPSWIDSIESSLRKRFDDDREVRLGLDTYVRAGVLGYARETHVREAVRNLYENGVTATDPKGKLQGRILKRA